MHLDNIICEKAAIFFQGRWIKISYRVSISLQVPGLNRSFHETGISHASSTHSIGTSRYSSPIQHQSEQTPDASTSHGNNISSSTTFSNGGRSSATSTGFSAVSHRGSLRSDIRNSITVPNELTCLQARPGNRRFHLLGTGRVGSQRDNLSNMSNRDVESDAPPLNNSGLLGPQRDQSQTNQIPEDPPSYDECMAMPTFAGNHRSSTTGPVPQARPLHPHIPWRNPAAYRPSNYSNSRALPDAPPSYQSATRQDITRKSSGVYIPLRSLEGSYNGPSHGDITTRIPRETSEYRDSHANVASRNPSRPYIPLRNARECRGPGHCVREAPPFLRDIFTLMANSPPPRTTQQRRQDLTPLRKLEVQIENRLLYRARNRDSH